MQNLIGDRWLVGGHGRNGGGTPPFVPPVPTFSGAMVPVSGEDDANYGYWQIADVGNDGQLTFDKACTFDMECIPSGGTAGGGQYQQPGGGGGASVPTYSTHTVSAGAVLNISMGAPGAKSSFGQAPNPGTGITIPELGIAADPGGTGGNGSNTAAHRYGLSGACGGGGNQALDNPIYNALGTLGGDGSVRGNGTKKQSGSGGGAAGDAGPGDDPDRAPAGPGVVSWLGDTVCAGGQGGWNVEVKNGDDATGYGCGGEGGSMTGTQSVTGGLGGPPRLVIRIAPAFEMSRPVIGPETIYNFPFPLNAAMTAAQVPLAFTTNIDGAYEARPVYHDDETPAADWISLGTVAGGSFDSAVTVPLCGRAVRWEIRRVGEVGTRTFVQPGMPWITSADIMFTGQSNSKLQWNGASSALPIDGTEAGLLPYAAFVGADASDEFSPDIWGLVYCNSTSLNAFAEEWYDATGIPICLIHGGRSSSAIAYHLQASTDISPYNIFTKYQGALALVPYMHGIGWYQGETDCVTAPNLSQYTSDANQLRSELAALTGQTATDIPWLAVDLGSWGDASAAQEGYWSEMKLHQADWSNQMTNGHFRCINGDFVRKDAYHADPQIGGYDRLMKRAARTMAWMLGKASDPGRFRATSGTATNTTTTTIALSHNAFGTDFSFVAMNHEAVPTEGTPVAAASADALFEVLEDGSSTPTACTAVRTDAGTVTLTHAAIPQAGRQWRIRSDAAVAQAVVDNSPYSWPLEIADWTPCI